MIFGRSPYFFYCFAVSLRTTSSTERAPLRKRRRRRVRPRRPVSRRRRARRGRCASRAVTRTTTAPTSTWNWRGRSRDARAAPCLASPSPRATSPPWPRPDPSRSPRRPAATTWPWTSPPLLPTRSCSTSQNASFFSLDFHQFWPRFFDAAGFRWCWIFSLFPGLTVVRVLSERGHAHRRLHGHELSDGQADAVVAPGVRVRHGELPAHGLYADADAQVVAQSLAPVFAGWFF